MADTGVQFQANFKLPDGTLLNVYADGFATFETQLGNLQSAADLIKSVSQSLGAASTGGSNAIAYAKQALGATVVGSTGGNTCKHGNLVWRESKPDAAKPWKGWFCPSPKGTPDQCEPKFVR
jgi:hypothetical protein